MNGGGYINVHYVQHTPCFMEVDGEQLLVSARAVLAHPGSEDQRRAAFPEFFLSNPRLFDIICSGRCDLRHLEMMVSMLRDIGQGTKTVEEASSVVADTLNLTYIESVIGAPTPEQAVRPGQETTVSVVEGQQKYQEQLGQSKKRSRP